MFPSEDPDIDRGMLREGEINGQTIMLSSIYKRHNLHLSLRYQYQTTVVHCRRGVASHIEFAGNHSFSSRGPSHVFQKNKNKKKKKKKEKKNQCHEVNISGKDSTFSFRNGRMKSLIMKKAKARLSLNES